MRLGWAEPQEGAWSPPVADHAGAPSARLRHLPPLTMRGRRPAGCAGGLWSRVSPFSLLS